MLCMAGKYCMKREQGKKMNKYFQNTELEIQVDEIEWEGDWDGIQGSLRDLEGNPRPPHVQVRIDCWQKDVYLREDDIKELIAEFERLLRDMQEFAKGKQP